MRTVFVLLVLAATAHADPGVTLAPALQDGFVPTVEATIAGAPLVPTDSITLRELGEQGSVVASQVRTYADGPEPVAIAIVMNGGEVFMGNEDVEKDENARYLGVLRWLEEAIDAIEPKTLAPPASKVVVVSYAAGAKVIVPMRPLAELRGSMLGTQHDYRGEIGSDMIAGIQSALAELSRVVITRKVMIVIGDGNDTNDDTARWELDALKAQAEAAHVETFAIIYKSPISSDREVISHMIPQPIAVNSVKSLEAAIVAIKNQITDRYYVTFPATALWDGGEHELVVRLDRHDLMPQTLTLPGRAASPRWARWLLLFGGGTLVLGLIALRSRPRFGLG